MDRLDGLPLWLRLRCLRQGLVALRLPLILFLYYFWWTVVYTFDFEVLVGWLVGTLGSVTPCYLDTPQVPSPPATLCHLVCPLPPASFVANAYLPLLHTYNIIEKLTLWDPTHLTFPSSRTRTGQFDMNTGLRLVRTTFPHPVVSPSPVLLQHYFSILPLPFTPAIPKAFFPYHRFYLPPYIPNLLPIPPVPTYLPIPFLTGRGFFSSHHILVVIGTFFYSTTTTYLPNVTIVRSSVLLLNL